MENSLPAADVSKHRWPLFIIGALLFVAGPVVYFVQMQRDYLGVPWSVPILATLGMLFMLASVLQRRGILRIAGFVLFASLCGLEWLFVLVLAKTPAYTGPAEVGRPAPAFATTLADGTEFSNRDLAKAGPTVMLFFRGRW